jgi:alpha-amylase
LSKLHLLLLIHAHQPVGNFDHVLERAYANSYRPFLELLLRHPSIRLGLHYSGALLEWIERMHPEFFDLVRKLVRRGQVELVGGGFYEPILIAIPPEDRLNQLRRLAEYLEKHIGRRPIGAWLAERVWEPQLPATLAAAGVDYVLVDDVHFIASGFDPGQLYGYYIAEDLGATVKVIPGLKALRYLIPFHSVEETIAFLRSAAQEHPGGLAAMGDDCEKFGVWPGTADHCYRDAWLARFLNALEANSDWLATTTPGEYLAAHPPLGRAELPAASYTEMMEWALPTPVRQRFHTLQQEFSSRPEVLAFLRGGFWRTFLSKYPEANLLHKKMLHVSGKIRRLRARPRRSLRARRALDQATTHLLRAQCNDALWHGIFGGLYAPHLRAALWRELVRAERLAGAVEHGRSRYAELTRLDFDGDAHEEINIASENFAALLKPSDGASLAALDFRTAELTLINSIARRPEPYHARLREAAEGARAGVVSIHDQIRVKEEGLDLRLRYDRWPRNAFRLLLFAPWKGYGDYEAVRLEESGLFAGGPYSVVSASEQKIELHCEGPLAASTPGSVEPGIRLRAAKAFSFSRTSNGFEVCCDLDLSQRQSEPIRLQVGLELVLNLLAPDQPDRYFEAAGIRHPLSWAGAVAAYQLRAVDEWQNVAVTIEASSARELWIAPIETVSESEEGFERVYQGSQILAVWPLALEPGTAWSGRLALRVARAR